MKSSLENRGNRVAFSVHCVRGADGTKSGVERRIWKSIKGSATGEPSLAGFGGSLSAVLSVVSAKEEGPAKAEALAGEDSLSRGSKAGKSWRRGQSGGGDGGGFHVANGKQGASWKPATSRPGCFQGLWRACGV